MKITAVVCTCDRPETLGAALDSVYAQTLAPAEVVVVDDGVTPAEVSSDAPVPTRVVRLGGAGPGAARQAGLDAAQSPLIAWCDDDDRWAPRHLEVLAAELERQPDVAVVYADADWYEAGATHGPAYSIDYEHRLLRYDNYLFPSTMLARTEVLRAVGGFDASLPAYEDWDLWLRVSVEHRMWHVPESLGELHWSPDGVAAGDRWPTHAEVLARHDRRMEQEGDSIDHGLPRPAPPPAFDPASWLERRELVFHSIVDPNHSFGVVSRHLIEALLRAGVDVRLLPTRNQPPEALRSLYRDPCDDGVGRLGFYYDFRRRPSIVPTERTVNYAMWESTQLPPGELEEIARGVSLQLVPSTRNAETYRAAGVGVPVDVLPHGVEPSRFPLLERPVRDVVTFGTFSDFSPRKGIDVLIDAFTAEFAPDEPVRLLLRSTRGGHGFAGADPRIELFTPGVVNQFTDPTPLHDLLREMDVFVMPSRGEPWGLPGLEAMFTGLPLIATDWDGPADYMDRDDSLPLRYRLVDCGGIRSNSTDYHGQWAEPDAAHLRELMRWCVDHRDELPAMGRRAAERVRGSFTWDDAAATLSRHLDRLAAS